MLADIGPDDVVLARVLDFLPIITTPEGGVPFVLETVADAPRAPWWNTDPDPPAALNPTASIAGLLYKLGVTHPWLETATGYVWAQLEALAKKEQMDGGWPISWPAVSPGSELEYRGVVTLNALKTLRAYGML